ncbi:MAG: hemolysin family protein, partial [Candidatus Aerophobetes bacterium]|nr:hemolysin family protein [Candidatus Aerophobetes bacterium]
MGQQWALVALLIICIGLSAFFSGSEIALSSLDKLTLKSLIEENKKKNRWVKSLLSRPSRWLITILIGNNLVNIAAASSATLLIENAIGGTPGKIAGIATGVTTFIILLFGEIIPKRYCQQHARAISLKVARPIFVLSIVFSPLVKALTFLSQGILKITGTKELKKEHPITEKEIHTLIDIGEEEGALEKGEEELVHSALEFDETQAKEIMVSRTKMVCIEQEAILSELIDLVKKSGYSRIPVYQENIDNIVGLAYIKDILNLLPGMNKNLKVKEIMHPPVFVPYTTRLSELFRRLQREKTHLTIVVDEYGGVAGMITMEDLLEEIVGEIEDEYDQEEGKIQVLKDRSALIEADTDIDEINEKLSTHLPEKTDAFESIGGFIINLLGRIPERGEAVKYEDLRIIIVDVDER